MKTYVRRVTMIAMGLLAGMAAGAETAASHREDRMAAAQSAGTFMNPVLAGDWPDASIVRVGGDYYMTHTSGVYAPGLLIWHSKDLVHWEPVTHALKSFDGDVWAPDLVHHNGRFYIYYPTKGTNKVIWSDRIEGPWSEPIDLKLPHIDPGHIVDQATGQRHLYLSSGYVSSLANDGLSAACPPKKVYDGWAFPSEWRVENFCLESPKLLYREGWYHLFSAEGGTAGPSTSHMVVHARSKSVVGPWENSPYNPIIRTRSPVEKWWSRGHATVFDAADGSWWMIYHSYEKDFLALGRNNLLEPVEWTKDGWLRVKAGSDPALPMAAPKGEAVDQTWKLLADDFQASELKWQWQFYKQHDPSRYGVGGGTLRLKGRGLSVADSSPLVINAGSHAYAWQVDVELEGDAQAGLVLFYSEQAHVGIGISPKAAWWGPRAPLREWPGKRPASRVVTLRMVNENNEVDFYMGEQGGPLKKVFDSQNVSGYTAQTFGSFLSLRPGLYCTGEGTALFRNFKFQHLSNANAK